MWWKRISTMSAGHSSESAAIHTTSSSAAKTYQSRNIKKEVANCPAFTHFISQQGLGTLTQQWFHSQSRLLGARCLLVATDNQLMGFAGRHMSA